MKHFLLTAFLIVCAMNVHAQCAPSFTWAQTAPNEITFTNTTTPIVQDSTTFAWFFGDNQTSSDQDPVHIYGGPDTIEVCLIVMDSILNCSAMFCDTVIVTGNVVCNLIAYVYQMQPAACVSCPTGVAGANTNGGTSPFTYLWSNGETDQMIGQLLPGLYSCTVTDVYGCTATAMWNIGTGNQQSCSAYWNNLHVSGDSVLFRNSSLTSFWGEPVQYDWTFGDNTTGTGDTLYHEYMYADTFTVCLTITDSLFSCYDSFCDTVQIDSIPPPVYCGADIYTYQDLFNHSVIWNLSWGSFTAEYYWSWGDNTYDTLQYPTHVYTVPGTYLICVTVNDTASQCTDSTCITLTIPPGSTPYTVEVSQIPIGISPAPENKISVYPNPVESVLFVTGASQDGSAFTITDVTGRTVRSGTLDGAQVDVSALTNGIYFFSLISKNGTVSVQRFIRN